MVQTRHIWQGSILTIFWWLKDRISVKMKVGSAITWSGCSDSWKSSLGSERWRDPVPSEQHHFGWQIKQLHDPDGQANGYPIM